MNVRTKNISLLFLVVTLVSLVFLAASLSNVQIQSGSSFQRGDNTINRVITLPVLKSFSVSIIRGIIAVVFLIFMIYLPARIISSVNIKIYLRLALIMVILLVILYLIPRINFGQVSVPPNGSYEIITPPSIMYSAVPLGEPPQILTWLVIFLIVLVMSITTVKTVKQWLDPTQLEHDLLQEAEDAVNALDAGVNLRNVIIRCYLQMSRSLQEEQGIQRNYTMTVREFEDWLTSMGFPTDPVHQLTILFEKVRYGEQYIGENEKKVAVESLNKIIEFCRSDKV
jgi:hypothetical protein